MEYQIVLTTCPSQEIAEKLAEGLVNEQLAACVSIIPNVTSVYKWKGVVEKAQEIQLILKCRAGQFAAIKDYILAHHPYELPELIAVPLSDGLPAYLDWIKEQTV